METLKRQVRDLNNKIFNTSNNSNTSQQHSLQISSLTEKTKSLSMISNNNNHLSIKDIMAFYDQLDLKLFSQDLQFIYILSERAVFDNIQQIENQRLLLEHTENSTVFIAMKVDTQQIIIIKELELFQQDELIKRLDEFKIHYKINNLFPQDSLQLITPVSVSKYRQSFGLRAALEKAECNLYEYSRKNTISDNQAYNIFRQLLRQIVNLHSVQIAHRDIKPQNIFYVQNKGWILSDFGESQEYQYLESDYNIRGTLYFLMPFIQQKYNRDQYIQQNLLINDLYALIVSMIIIQNMKHINILDVQQEISNLKDQYLIQALSIKSLQKLLEFQQNLYQRKEEIYFNSNLSYYKHLDPQQQQINQYYNYKSWLQLTHYFASRKIFPELSSQLLNLISSNIRQIQSQISAKDVQNLIILRAIKLKKKSVNQQFIFQNITKQSITQHEIYIQLLFSSGYSETAMLNSQLILENQYNQFIHLLLIDSLERMQMYSEAFQQFKTFQQGLLFEELDTELQSKFLLKLQYYGSDYLQLDKGQKIEDQLNIRNIDQTIVDKFLQDFNQAITSDYSKSITLLKTYIQENFQQYSIQDLSHIFYLIKIISSENDIHVYYQSLELIYKLRPDVFDFNRRNAILFYLGQIFVFLDNKGKLNKIIKKAQKQSLRAESNQQRIAFQIKILVLKFYKQFQYKKINVIEKLWVIIKRLDLITYNYYARMIQEYLFNLLELLYKNQDQLLSKGMKIIIKIIEFAFQYKYYESKFKYFQFYHKIAQNILIYQKNHKRCLKLIKDHQDQLTQTTISYYKLFQERRKELMLADYLQSQPKLIEEKEFLFRQYLHKRI